MSAGDLTAFLKDQLLSLVISVVCKYSHPMGCLYGYGQMDMRIAFCWRSCHPQGYEQRQLADELSISIYLTGAGRRLSSILPWDGTIKTSCFCLLCLDRRSRMHVMHNAPVPMVCQAWCSVNTCSGVKAASTMHMGAIRHHCD